MQLAAVTAKQRRWKCDACPRYYWSVLGTTKCPDCASGERAAAGPAAPTK